MSDELIAEYERTPKVGMVAPVTYGTITGDNTRFIRKPWELNHSNILAERLDDVSLVDTVNRRWVAFIKGAAGLEWFEPLNDTIDWKNNGLQLKTRNDHKFEHLVDSSKTKATTFCLALPFPQLGQPFELDYIDIGAFSRILARLYFLMIERGASA